MSDTFGTIVISLAVLSIFWVPFLMGIIWKRDKRKKTKNVSSSDGSQAGGYWGGDFGGDCGGGGD